MKFVLRIGKYIMFPSWFSQKTKQGGLQKSPINHHRRRFSCAVSRLFQSDWTIGLVLLIIFLSLAGYRYGWDDQHLEIPLLKGLIDPGLYPHDYYVQSLKTHFPSYFYSLLARVITVEQVPTAYATLYILSRFFMLFWMYKLWRLIAGEKFLAFVCVIVLFTFGRVPEFFYQTFSHQEFSLAIVLAGLYYFYKDRFLLAASLWGLGANVHAIYSLFPMVYMTIYFLICWRKIPFKQILLSIISFVGLASPVIWLIIQKKFLGGEPGTGLSGVNWLGLYRTHCLQNFIFFGASVDYLRHKPLFWLQAAQKEVLLIGLLVFNAIWNNRFKSDSKAHAIVIGAGILLAVSYVFTYIHPSRFVIDLNLIRNEQFLSFLLSGYTVLLMSELLAKKDFGLGLSAILTMTLLLFDPLLSSVVIIFLIAEIFVFHKWETVRSQLWRIGYITLLGLFLLIAILNHRHLQLTPTGLLMAELILGGFTAAFWLSKIPALRSWGPTWSVHRLWLSIPVLVIAVYLGFHHFSVYKTSVLSPKGFWRLQANWEDMQRYAQANTSKDAVFLTPHDMEMGGFRIHSERSVVFCDRDFGLIGFDYSAALEALKRQYDIQTFKVQLTEELKTETILKAVYTYRADYVVFMKYYAPTDLMGGLYTKIYENEAFILFKVDRKRIEGLLLKSRV